MNAQPPVDPAVVEARRQTLLSMWQEAREHGRLHEAHRASATNMMLVLAAAGIGAAATLPLGTGTVPLALGLILLGAFGFLLSAKHHERWKRTLAVAVEFENRIDALDPGLGLRASKDRAHEAHDQEHARWARIRLNQVWSLLHVFVMLIGVVVLIASVVRM
ncbi:hypothetical protein [Dactylosporangium sp. NPDC000521]|uniref:hypothetical protein n=1 Tax=Dactylosporangium sp. NPDC000521 TaxID=3363975 RepID=UPI0036A6FABD